MYTIQDLNVRLLSELKEIASELGLENYKKLPKKELIYKILDFQAANPIEVKPSASTTEKKPQKAKTPKTKTRKEEKPVDEAPKDEKKKKLSFKRENVKNIFKTPRIRPWPVRVGGALGAYLLACAFQLSMKSSYER